MNATQHFQENGKYYPYTGKIFVSLCKQRGITYALLELKDYILFNYRAARGKHLSLIIRFANPGRSVDEIDIFTHSNDTLGSLRRQILRKIKANASNVKLDLFLNGEPLEPTDDRKLLSQTPLRDKMVCFNGF